jgi:hypothetical protein
VIESAEDAIERSKLNTLSPAAKQHLRELLDAPYWLPQTAGEWAIARALERRGFVGYDPTRGHQPYALTERGRAAGQRLREATS